MMAHLKFNANCKMSLARKLKVKYLVFQMSGLLMPPI